MRVAATYTVRIMANPGNEDWPDQEVVDSLSHAIHNAEGLVNASLPEGYYCKFDGPQSPRGKAGENGT
jgi:hypothetical protein